MLTIVLPTYNEKENILRLIPLIHSYFRDIPYKVLVVDDNSPDGTATAAETLKKWGFPVQVIVRNKKSGLASATLYGLKHTNTKYVAVMDADLQHDPKYLLQMYKKILSNPYMDMVIGSRYVNGANFSDWPMHRKAISITALFIYSLFTKAKDPLGQFYIIKRRVLDFKKLEGFGNRLSLEILAKLEPNFLEHPIIFKDRKYGKSKILNIKSIIIELQNIYRLFGYKLNCIYNSIFKVLS